MADSRSGATDEWNIGRLQKLPNPRIGIARNSSLAGAFVLYGPGKAKR
jgi:hypothetical protein